MGLEDHFDNLLQDRDKKMGFGGTCSVVIANDITANVLVVHNLEESAARILFDQIDESNRVNSKFTISLYRGKDVIDYNKLPNAFTEQL